MEAAMENFVSAKPRTARDVLAAIIHKGSPEPGLDASLKTGFHPLDDVLGGGMSPQDLVLLGGKPGVGKTIAMIQWARNMAMTGARVVFASYELSERNLLGRLLMSEIAQKNQHLDQQTRSRMAKVVRDTVKAGAVSADPAVREVVRQAYDAIDSYADRLLIQRVSGYHTGPPSFRSWHRNGSVLAVPSLSTTSRRFLSSVRKMTASVFFVSRRVSRRRRWPTTCALSRRRRSTQMASVSAGCA